MSTAVQTFQVEQPAGPSVLRIYSKEIRYEFLKLMRNRAYTLSVAGFPVIFYLMFASINRGEMYQGHLYGRYLLAGYACFGSMGASLFGIGGGLSHERTHGWLELKRSSPMPVSAYLVAKVASAVFFSVAITLLLTLLGTLLCGHLVGPLELGKLLLTVVGGCIPFACLGLLMGLVMPPNSAPGVINLVYLPLSFCGGMWMPVEILPNWLQPVSHVLPSYYFSRLALRALDYRAAVGPLVCWAVLAGYAVVLLTASAWVFRRSEARA